MPPFSTAPHICILRSPPPPPALRDLRSLCATPPYPCSNPRHRGTRARFPFCFPQRAWAGGSSATFGCISWVFHCARPTAFPLTSPWTGPNVYEPWPATPPPHPRHTFLHTYGARLLPTMTSTSVLFMRSQVTAGQRQVSLIVLQMWNA